MWVTHRFLFGFKKQSVTALTLAISLGAFGGCLVDQESGGETEAAGVNGPSALRDKSTSGEKGAPGLACSQVWNAVAMDSVLYCPDPRPPRP